MATQWKGTVQIDAPVEQVYEYLADFTRHTEWDESTHTVEQVKSGDANGIGAKFKVREHLQTLKSDRQLKPIMRPSVGIVMREVQELIPHQRIAWSAYAVPRIGVTGEFAFNLVQDGNTTQLSQSITYRVPKLVDGAANLVLRSLDRKQYAQWERNLENIRVAVEQPSPAASEAQEESTESVDPANELAGAPA